MSEIIVIGHKNPDTDSACAAWSYARFKNIVNPETRYVAAVCGSLGEQTKFVFSNAGVEPPVYLKDVRPRAQDIADADCLRLNSNDPIALAFEDLDEQAISIVPVFEGEDTLSGVISMHEITRYFVDGNLKSRPCNTFRLDNIEKVLPGRFLKRGEQEEFNAPILIGAMNFENSVKYIQSLEAAKPLMVVGHRPDLINYAIDCQVPAIILTGFDLEEEPKVDFSRYEGSVYLSESDTAETVRQLHLSVPVKQIMDAQPQCLTHDTLFDDAKKALFNSEYRGLPVLRKGRFAGVVTRASFIEKPKRKLILVDHNEIGQAILGAEDAEICEIIDHHRLGAEKTSTPIYIYSKPIGSTCSIVFAHYRMAGIEPDQQTALLMLSGLLSDTMLLRSPTTTPEDCKYATELAKLAGVDLQEYGTRMLSCVASLKTADPVKVVGADYKEYAEHGFSAGVGQVEVGTLADIEDVKASLMATLNDFRKERNLTWSMLLVTDIVREHSVLLCTEWPAAENELAYKKLEAGMFDLPGVLSRKKQLLPEVLRILDVVAKG